MFDDLQLLTMSEVCALAKMGKTTLYDAISKQQFPKPIKINRLSRWREKDIREWQRQQFDENEADQQRKKTPGGAPKNTWPDDPMFS